MVYTPIYRLNLLDSNYSDIQYRILNDRIEFLDFESLELAYPGRILVYARVTNYQTLSVLINALVQLNEQSHSHEISLLLYDFRVENDKDSDLIYMLWQNLDLLCTNVVLYEGKVRGIKSLPAIKYIRKAIWNIWNKDFKDCTSIVVPYSYRMTQALMSLKDTKELASSFLENHKELNRILIQEKGEIIPEDLDPNALGILMVEDITDYVKTLLHSEILMKSFESAYSRYKHLVMIGAKSGFHKVFKQESEKISKFLESRFDKIYIPDHEVPVEVVEDFDLMNVDLFKTIQS